MKHIAESETTVYYECEECATVCETETAAHGHVRRTEHVMMKRESSFVALSDSEIWGEQERCVT